jgi:hypothetical protein
MKHLVVAGLLALVAISCSGQPTVPNADTPRSGGGGNGSESVSVPSGASRWSDPLTWGGRVPDQSSSVTIAQGQTMALDANVNVRNLTVMGTLVCADRDLKLTAGWVMVHAPGKLECGTAAKPFTKRLEIVLNASDENENAMGMGTKFLGAMGGTLDLHGVSKTSWTKLADTVEPGATQLRVLEASGWQVGDRIAIAPTDFNPDEAEDRTIRAINGSTLTLDAPLRFRHWGKVQTLGATAQTMDERAEVANLTRNIVIRGDNKTGSGFGAHTMYMTGSTVRMQNVEITGMGQVGRLGRYPWHAHLLGDGGRGSYLKNSAVHDNLQRGLVIHRSNNLTFENNVVYNTQGHMVFLESSNESGNVFDRNLVMKTRPFDASAMNSEIGFDHQPDFRNSTARVSGFWISNQNNRFTNNTVASITQGHGYWFVEAAALYTGRDNDLWEYRPGVPEYDRAPYRGALVFEDNTAHTIRPDAAFGGSNPMRVAGNGVMLDGVRLSSGLVPTLKRLRVWKVAMYGVWGLGGNTVSPVIEGLVTADSKSAIFSGEHNGPLAVRGGTFYGMTDNQPSGVSAATRDWYNLWVGFGNFPDDRSIEPVSTYPDTLGAFPSSGAVPEAALTAPGSVTGGQRFTAFSNVTFGGWPQR